MAPSGTEAFFGCAYCHEVFPEQHELEVHQKIMHPGKTFSFVPAALPERERALLKKAPTAAITNRIPLSEVNRHCIPDDCWVAIDGKVYDLTEFMDRHPGGPTLILSWAGKDATKTFKDIHKGVRIDAYLRPEASVGELGIDPDLMSEEYWHCLRKARIAEIEEELGRICATVDGGSAHKKEWPSQVSSLEELLHTPGVNEALVAKMRRLETQKRVALDAEDFVRAQEIKDQEATILAAARVEIGVGEQQGVSGGIPLSEVARHNKPHDLWVALNGSVYDLTDFLKHHPEQRNVLLSWAGRDATPVWNKIPGRFPSENWMKFYLHPDARMGDIGIEPKVSPEVETIRQLRTELRRLQGPSEDDIAAAKVGAAAKRAGKADEVTKAGEEERYPKLKDISAGKDLPFFTRAEVAKHKGPAGGPPGTEPYMILHNKVYDLTPLLGGHPGGDDTLLSRAGLDATKEFELFEHSEKARIRRDQDLLVGQIVPAEHTDYTTVDAAADGVVVPGAEPAESDLVQYLKYKITDGIIIALAMYAHKSWQHRKPLPMLMYSRLLRHLHLIMAVGLFGTLASVQAAAQTEGLAKKRLLQIHKQSGVAMLAALVLRIFARARSGIPPRFPGNPIVQAIETQSLRAFYVLCLILPVSGMANEYYLKWASGDDNTNDKYAQQSIEVHKKFGKFFQYVWLPFHLGYTTLYHFSQGRGVVRKVSPFI